MYIYLYFIYIYFFYIYMYVYTCVIRGETNRYVAYNACTYVRVQYKRRPRGVTARRDVPNSLRRRYACGANSGVR